MNKKYVITMKYGVRVSARTPTSISVSVAESNLLYV